MTTVLVHEYVTGGGFGQEAWSADLLREARAMRRALAEDLAALEGVRVVLTHDERLTDEPGPWQLIGVKPGREYDAVCGGLDQADAAIIVAPETEGVLTERASWLQGHPCRSLISSPAAVELAAEKWTLAHHFDRMGISCPPTLAIFNRAELPGFNEFPYPAVLKPFDGAGCQRVFFVSDPADFPHDAEDDLPALLQAYVPGTPMSASFLVADDGKAVLVGVGRQRVGIEEGRLYYRGGVVPAGSPEMAAEPARAIATIPGLRGWVGVDFIWNEASAQAYIIEVNPRLTTSYVGWRRHLAPGDLARLWLWPHESPEAADSRALARSLRDKPPLSFEPDGSFSREERGDPPHEH